MSLTPGQRAVVELIAKGLTNEQIADRLGLSKQTVKNHITAALRANGLSNRTQLALYLTSGVPPPEERLIDILTQIRRLAGDAQAIVQELGE